MLDRLSIAKSLSKKLRFLEIPVIASRARFSLASSLVPVMPWDLSDIAMCGWCVDGLTFSPLFLYSISIQF